MSYILEALRKADAQRQRERPGLHAQPAPASLTDEPRAWGRAAGWAALAAIAVALAVAAIAWWPSAETSVPDAVSSSMPRAVPAPAPAPAPVVVAPAATRIEPPPPLARPDPPPPAAVAREARGPASALTAAPVARAAPAASKPQPVVEGAAPADAPRLAISGGVYSQAASQRMLIVGGQVFNEGSQVAPGVVLEEVRPNQAVLSFRGQRYTVAY